MHYYFAIIGILGTALCAGLGLFTLLRNPRHPANIGFTLGMGSLAVIEAGATVVLLSPLQEDLAHTGARILLSGQAALPAAWLLFSVVFARANNREALARWTPVLVLCSAVSLFFIFKSGSLFSSNEPSGMGPSLFSHGYPHLALSPLGRYFSIYLIIGSVLNLVHLENTLRSSSGSTRWHIKYIIFGVGSILAYFIYLSSQYLLFSALEFETVPLTAAIILVSTSMMAVFIVKHRLLDVDIFISRYVIYNSLTVLIVGLYLIAVGIIAQGIRFFQVPFSYFFTTLFIFTSVLLLVVFLFTTSLRRKVQLFINKHFYKHKYEFRDKWMETIEKISSKRSVSDIGSTLKEMVSESTCAKPVYLWLYEPASKNFATEQADAPEGLKKIPSSHPFAEYVKGDPAQFSVDDAVPANITGISSVFRETGAVLCVPLVAGSETMGFVLLGPDISGEPYIQDDFEFLKAVTTQAAVQIKSIRLTQDLMAAKEVEAFSKMSYFIMHDLKNLTNSLSLISQNARHSLDNPEFQRDAIKTIDGTVERMKGLIERLSSVPRDIELKMEVTTAAEIINKALKKLVFSRTKPVTITVDNGTDGDRPLKVDPDAIEMVILNLASNAYDAIVWEGCIQINTSLDGDYLDIAVSDNGAGISKDYIDTDLFKPFRTTKKKGFGIGLYQCKSIIEAHGGDIAVESEAGRGTRFTVKLPLLKDAF